MKKRAATSSAVDSTESKRKKNTSTAAEALMANLPMPREIMVLRNGDGIHVGFMQQVPLVSEAEFPMNGVLLTKFGLSDEVIKNKLLFFFQYMFDFSGQGAPVLEGLRQLAAGMNRSVEATHRVVGG